MQYSSSSKIIADHQQNATGYSKRRKNFIAHLKVDGVLVSDQEDKANAVDVFFEELLGSAPDRPHSLDLDFLGKLDKAPGLDGFSGRFYVACWPIIKKDVMEALHALWSGDCRGLHKANQALVSLLPKHAEAVEVKDFWPISLIHSVAKLLAKLVHCTARKLHALKRDSILLKLDITKAFDTVDWAFLLEVLTKLGFGRSYLHPPLEVDLLTCAAIVEDFGVASGLRTNLAKCSLHPIRCQPEQVDLARQILGCEVGSFPFKYLGLPLSLRKFTAAQLQPLVDSATSRLPTWCAKLLNRGGRTILVQTTLSAIPVHAMMSLDIPPKVLEVLRKICRAFLWKGREEIQGGHCLVAWDKVASPKVWGGLGIPNLKLLNVALRCKWAWLKWVDPTKAWAGFDIKLPGPCMAIFKAATCVVLGDGERASFWKDLWLDGMRVVDIAPNVVKLVSVRSVNSRSVKEGLTGRWLLDVGPDLGPEALAEFFLLWHRLANIVLNPEREDMLVWRWSRDGQYSS
ncbi:uncharacterized protein [Lolium perenne]|uniref:uncharacterized protein n=1 Tax=Lolium perenne TaxID=4522 RepID=UPI003A99E6FC